MLIGPWNLAAKGRAQAHAKFLSAQKCDVWLLTEVTADFDLPGYVLHATTGTMQQGQSWAGVLSRLPAQQLAEPHPASAACRNRRTCSRVCHTPLTCTDLHGLSCVCDAPRSAAGITASEQRDFRVVVGVALDLC